MKKIVHEGVAGNYRTTQIEFMDENHRRIFITISKEKITVHGDGIDGKGEMPTCVLMFYLRKIRYG